MSVGSVESEVGMMMMMEVDVPLGDGSEEMEMGAEDVGKRIRKPYTITKSRQSWTEHEHGKFLEALQLFERDWKKIEAFIGSKNVIQIRSHAQKYFLKVQKNGTGEHVPPPRPKRKSSQPYPHKATKYAFSFKPAQGVLSSSQSEQVYRGTGEMLIPAGSDASGAPAWSCHTMTAARLPFDTEDPVPAELQNSSSVMGDPSFCVSGGPTEQWSQPLTIVDQHTSQGCLQDSPDFSEVYKFIGSVFDPDVKDHLDILKRMIPIDRETVLLLMKNLASNLSSPDLEGQVVVQF